MWTTCPDPHHSCVAALQYSHWVQTRRGLCMMRGFRAAKLDTHAVLPILPGNTVGLAMPGAFPAVAGASMHPCAGRRLGWSASFRTNRKGHEGVCKGLPGEQDWMCAPTLPLPTPDRQHCKRGHVLQDLVKKGKWC
jgi:hypothetical protein